MFVKVLTGVAFVVFVLLAVSPCLLSSRISRQEEEDRFVVRRLKRRKQWAIVTANNPKEPLAWIPTDVDHADLGYRLGIPVENEMGTITWPAE